MRRSILFTFPIRAMMRNTPCTHKFPAHNVTQNVIYHSRPCMRPRVPYVFNERRKLHQCDNKFRQQSNLMCCSEFCIGIRVCAVRYIQLKRSSWSHTLVPRFKYRKKEIKTEQSIVILHHIMTITIYILFPFRRMHLAGEHLLIFDIETDCCMISKSWSPFCMWHPMYDVYSRMFHKSRL